MAHQSLCSAIGMPHSTQIRVRTLGASSAFPIKRLSNDMQPPGVAVKALDDANQPKVA
jgi:hypothetical protein